MTKQILNLIKESLQPSQINYLIFNKMNTLIVTTLMEFKIIKMYHWRKTTKLKREKNPKKVGNNLSSNREIQISFNMNQLMIKITHLKIQDNQLRLVCHIFSLLLLYLIQILSVKT